MRDTAGYEPLDERARNILMAVVQSFIQTAEPVGSRTISKRFEFGLSPATIRNVMADLEEMGFLEQPHTSAGRVPTDKGYRYYVDHLQGPEALSAEEAALIAQRFPPYRGEMDEVIAEISRLLSELSRYAGIVLRTLASAVFSRVELVKVRGPQVLAIFVLESGMVHHKLITLEEEMTQDELQRIANYLNQEFAGQPLRLIRQRIAERMAEEKVQYDQLLRQAMQVGGKTFEEAAKKDEEIVLGGTANIIDQPEFQSNTERMKELLRAFEDKSRLIRILDKCLEEPGVNVIIGSETPFKDVHECSFVTRTFHSGDRTIGVLGVVGPKRMAYPRVMALVDYTANLVTQLLTQG
ncbi:MAG: heat-inducible transcription repressor HrcA [Candidatus Tectimicrobiota bacterium]|nr:MAG: heat-inducible transcription repressor HrcA [Candidatus Tectomicrobia bacterium]